MTNRQPLRINRPALIEELSLHIDVPSKAAAARIIDFLFEQITDNVTAGNTVSISGFGKFEPFTRTNGAITPKFRPYKDFKQAVSA